MFKRSAFRPGFIAFLVYLMSWTSAFKLFLGIIYLTTWTSAFMRFGLWPGFIAFCLFNVLDLGVQAFSRHYIFNDLDLGVHALASGLFL